MKAAIFLGAVRKRPGQQPADAALRARRRAGTLSMLSGGVPGSLVGDVLVVALSGALPMLARNLAQPFPVVGPDTNALEAARLLVERNLPGLIVVDATGHPRTVLPGSQVLRFVIPDYVQEDPALARAYDERTADRLCASLANHPVRELLPRERATLPVVDGRATVMEVAAVMARLHSPLVAVVDGNQLLGAITVASLLGVLLPAS